MRSGLLRPDRQEKRIAKWKKPLEAWIRKHGWWPVHSTNNLDEKKLSDWVRRQGNSVWEGRAHVFENYLDLEIQELLLESWIQRNGWWPNRRSSNMFERALASWVVTQSNHGLVGRAYLYEHRINGKTKVILRENGYRPRPTVKGPCDEQYMDISA